MVSDYVRVLIAAPGGEPGWLGRGLSAHFSEQGHSLVDKDPDHIVILTVGRGPASDAELLGQFVQSTVDILERSRQADPAPRILLACSARCYGSSPQPLDSDAPLQPDTTYGVTQAVLDRLGYQYFHTFALNIARVRIFAPFVELAESVALAESQGAPSLLLGHPDSRWDQLPDADLWLALGRALTDCPAGEVRNLCSGSGARLGDVACSTSLALEYGLQDDTLVGVGAGPVSREGVARADLDEMLEFYRSRAQAWGPPLGLIGRLFGSA